MAVCDVNKAQAERVARGFEIPGVYDDILQMLESERPDFVDICTPPRTHADIAVTALHAGSHVLIEKPMAISVEECDQIIQASLETGREVCVAHSELFYPTLIEARNRVTRGDIGDFTGMRILRSVPVNYMTAIPDHWANRLPGGAIGETGPHLVYHTLAFINPIRDIWVSAKKLMPEYPWSPYDDYRIELIGDNATCSVVLTFTNRHWAAPVELWGTEGLLKVDLQSKTLVRADRGNLSPRIVGQSVMSEAMQMASGTLGTAAKVLTGRFRNAHDLLIKEFFERCVRGLSSPVTPQEGREAVRVMGVIVDQLEPAG